MCVSLDQSLCVASVCVAMNRVVMKVGEEEEDVSAASSVGTAADGGVHTLTHLQSCTDLHSYIYKAKSRRSS